MNKHTAGPWHWGKDYEGLFGANEEEILCHADYEGMWVRDYLKQGKIDAQLIVASPDLLAAALMVIDTIEGGSTKVEEAITATRAAIAKATGEQE